MSDFVNAKQVFCNVDLPSREDALSFLAKQAVALDFAEDVDAVLTAYKEREEEGPTGLTDGFAIPHAKCEAISKAGVIVVKLQNSIEWPNFDEQPTDILISLLIPSLEAGTTHVKLLSQIAVMLMDDDFKVQIRESNDSEAIAAMIMSRLNV